ncbi:MAG: hypothetical protein J6S49_01990 [Erysipelotrichaceae bacterium]|nr:hypothetical protein [Erysipelotrichaceae bacterium]
MADTEKKISELDPAAQINTDDITVLSQGNSGTGFASVKATILAIANKIVSGINFTSALQTTDKTITGAINEVAQGGGGGGSGGHTIIDDYGTVLPQEDDLQFAGTYSEDDSTNGKTVVNITREMYQADYDLLSTDEKTGIIRIIDDDFVCDGTEVEYSNGVSIKSKIDSMTARRVWSGSLYTVNNTFEIPNRKDAAIYFAVFRANSGAGYVYTFPFIGVMSLLQFSFWGDSTQFTRYRIERSGNIYTIVDVINGNTNSALLEIYEKA